MPMAKLVMQSDPQVYRRGIPSLCSGLARALSLDLATRCGIGMMDFDPKKPIVDATAFLDMWDLSVGDFDTSLIRFVRLRQFMEVISPSIVFFEDVRFDPPQGP